MSVFVLEVAFGIEHLVEDTAVDLHEAEGSQQSAEKPSDVWYYIENSQKTSFVKECLFGSDEGELKSCISDNGVINSHLITEDVASSWGCSFLEGENSIVCVNSVLTQLVGDSFEGVEVSVGDGAESGEPGVGAVLGIHFWGRNEGVQLGHWAESCVVAV